jgi:hypothetical protein
MLAERATHGLVVGVDPSPTMIAQASARNRNLSAERPRGAQGRQRFCDPVSRRELRQGLQHQQHLLLAITRRRTSAKSGA